MGLTHPTLPLCCTALQPWAHLAWPRDLPRDPARPRCLALPREPLCHSCAVNVIILEGTSAVYSARSGQQVSGCWRVFPERGTQTGSPAFPTVAVRMVPSASSEPALLQCLCFEHEGQFPWKPFKKISKGFVNKMLICAWNFKNHQFCKRTAIM